jgi:hypothetical protein
MSVAVGGGGLADRPLADADPLGDLPHLQEVLLRGWRGGTGRLKPRNRAAADAPLGGLAGGQDLGEVVVEAQAVAAGEAGQQPQAGRQPGRHRQRDDHLVAVEGGDQRPRWDGGHRWTRRGGRPAFM